MARWLLLALVLRCAAVPSATALADSLEREHSVQVPGAVRAFMASRHAPEAAEMQRLKDRFGNTFEPGVCLLYFSELPHGTRPGEQPAWLVGYRLGRLGHTWVNTAVMIDHDGRPLFPIMQERAGDNAVAFPLSPGIWGVAMSYEPSGQLPGYVRVLTLEQHSRELLRYSSPATENWESTLYFIDTDHRGVSAMLIRRAVFTDTGALSRRECAIRRFNGRDAVFSEEEPLSEAEFKEQLANANLHGSTAELTQSGSPR